MAIFRSSYVAALAPAVSCQSHRSHPQCRLSLQEVMSDRASKALAESLRLGDPRTYKARSRRVGVPLTTLYYRAHGRCSKEQKAEG